MDDSLIIASFKSIDDAKHAVDEMAAAGVPKHDIMLVASDDELDVLPQNALDSECDIVHTSTYEECGATGGAIGAVCGTLAGSCVAIWWGSVGGLFIVSLLVAGATGLITGALVTYLLPRMHSALLPHLFATMGQTGYRYNTQRLGFSGAGGGFYGALIGSITCYGIDARYFYLYWVVALLVAIVVGGVMGSLKGHVLEPRIPIHEQDLGDRIHRAIVSVNREAFRHYQSEIEAALTHYGRMG